MKEQRDNVIWAIDPVHTKIRFDIRYLLIATVSGWFTQFEGIIIAAEEDFSDAQVQLSIFTQSIDTGNESRDAHLRSADFFDAEKYPVISFESTSVTATGTAINMSGILRIKDLMEVIAFKVKHNGTTRDQMGNLKAGFEMESTFNRKDLNIIWNNFFDTCGVVLSDEVKIFCDVELLKL